jgi:hypothetical protein
LWTPNEYPLDDFSAMDDNQASLGGPLIDLPKRSHPEERRDRDGRREQQYPLRDRGCAVSGDRDVFPLAGFI